MARKLQHGVAAIGDMDFIARHNLYTEEQQEAVEEIVGRMQSEDLRTIRVSSADPHGMLRGKTVLADMFPSVLRNGIDFTSAVLNLDTSDGIAYNIFAEGGGLGDENHAGAPDLVLVPDPLTFRILPWAPRTGWCLASLHYHDGRPVPFDGRNLLKTQLDTLQNEFGLNYVAGLEVEFYLTRLVDGGHQSGDFSAPGNPGPAPLVAPLGAGYAYQSEDHQDQIEEILATFADHLLKLGLPLRTMEDEWGPGQCEFTFSPMVGTEAADSMLLFRAAMKQIARRLGLHATFMCRPKLPGFYASGWHLHQCLIDSDGANVFSTPKGSSDYLSATGMGFVGGLLEHASAASIFTTPTINGYRRRKPFSLAPDRATWGIDNRAAMLRLQGAPGDPSTHIENRVGEPAANPYFYLASQLAAGMDGMRRKLDPGPAEAEPYSATHRPLLPARLEEAIEVVRGSVLYRDAFGDRFVDWIAGLKEFEVARFNAAEGGVWDPEEVTEWEHREYFARF